jgi:hypothetical protein
MFHTNVDCIFSRKPYLFNKTNLLSETFLRKIPVCECHEFARIFIFPAYQNTELTLDEFKKIIGNNDGWRFLYSTKYTYNLASSRTKDCRDPYVKSALKELFPDDYYLGCDKNKTPKVGRMYASLLQYAFPLAHIPRKREFYFWKTLQKAENQVFSKLKRVKPISPAQALKVIPKGTSAGFKGLEYSGDGTRMKKSEILPFITDGYFKNLRNIISNKPVNDYCMFAMRGHLSDRSKVKTRPIWLVSASTIVAELRYYQPFYEQINENDFFKNLWITGHGSLPRLNKYLRKHPDFTFINTDISGWDSYRAAWFHERIMRKLGDLIDMDWMNKKEYEYCIESAIRTKVLLPDGTVWQKYAGIISGTAGTLLFNSLLNTIAGLCIMIMMKEFSYDPEDLPFNKVLDPNWLGDDFAFFYRGPGKFDLNKFTKLMFMYFNVVIKPEKTVNTDVLEERKYLGYQLKGGFLYRDTMELFQSVTYTERPFPKGVDNLAISFSRFFSYLLLGGINDYKFTRLFYYYIGKYSDKFEKLEILYSKGMDNIFKLLKDVWNVQIDSFNLNTFRNMNLALTKYCLLYGYDLKFSDLLV